MLPDRGTNRGRSTFPMKSTLERREKCQKEVHSLGQRAIPLHIYGSLENPTSGK